MAPGMFFYAECDDRHFVLSRSPCLESCFMCDKPLGSSSDIFMYRGNTPFCSTECRQELIKMDDAEERRRKRSALRTNSNSARSSDINKFVGTDTIKWPNETCLV